MSLYFMQYIAIYLIDLVITISALHYVVGVFELESVRYIESPRV